MTRIAHPKERVQAYLRDWHRSWKRMRKENRSGPWSDAWASLIEKVDQHHFLKGCESGTQLAFNPPALHHPVHEEVVDVSLVAGEAVVQTQSVHPTKASFSYRLKLADGDWRILNIVETKIAAGDELVALDERVGVLRKASFDEVLSPVETDVDVNGERLFEDGRVLIGDFDGTIEVERLGDVHLSSGIIGVRDLSYGAAHFEPLARKVKPGHYPIEVARAGGRIIAVRLLLGTKPVVRWHPASTQSYGHVVGVDFCNIAIFDAKSFVEMSASRKNRLVDLFWAQQDVARKGLIQLHSGRSFDGAVVSSGYGDGAYPSHWGVAADGEVQQLLVDFLVVAEFKEETVEVPWSDKLLGERFQHPTLMKFGVDVLIEECGGPSTRITTFDDPNSIRFLDDDGSVLLDTAGMGCTHTVSSAGRTVEYVWPKRISEQNVVVVEVTVGSGYQN